MKGELSYVQHPRGTHIAWGIFYICLFSALIAIFFIFAGRIRTYFMPTGAVQLSIPYKTYLVGEPITFTLTNNYNSPIYVSNGCPGEPFAVYRKEGGAWTRIHAETAAKDCLQKDRQIKVAAGATQSGSYADWPGLFTNPGQYRIVAYVEYFDVAPYQDFEVIARPKIAAAPTQIAANISTSTTEATDNTEAEITPAQVSPTLASKTVTVSSGSIYVKYSSTMIYVQSITPATGCTYEGGQSGSQVQVTLKCSQSETQVTLSLSGGQLVTRVENDD